MSSGSSKQSILLKGNLRLKYLFRCQLTTLYIIYYTSNYGFIIIIIIIIIITIIIKKSVAYRSQGSLTVTDFYT